MTDTPRETFKFAIDVTLTDEQITARLNRNAEIDRKILEIMADKAAANQGYNNDLKTLRKEQVTLLESAKAGKAKLEVDCYQDRDDRRGMMLTLRSDNGELVDERALTMEERGEPPDARQGKLFDDVGAPSVDAAEPNEIEERADEDTENALSEYAAQHAGEASSDHDGGAEAEHDEDDDDGPADADDEEQPAVN